MFEKINYFIIMLVAIICFVYMGLSYFENERAKLKIEDLEEKLEISSKELQIEQLKQNTLKTPIVLLSMSEVFDFFDNRIKFEMEKIVEHDFKMKKINFIDDKRAKDITEVVIDNTLNVMSQNMIDNLYLYYTREGLFNYIFYSILPGLKQSIEYYNLPKK